MGIKRAKQLQTLPRPWNGSIGCSYEGGNEVKVATESFFWRPGLRSEIVRQGSRDSRRVCYHRFEGK